MAASAQNLYYLDDLSLGQVFRSGVHRVDAEQIKAFARLYDPQPFHLDEEDAKDTFFAGLAASGWHVAAIAWPKPTRADDVLQVTSEVIAIAPSRSRPDRGMITLRSETRNQNGEIAQTLTAKLIVPKRPA